MQLSCKYYFEYFLINFKNDLNSYKRYDNIYATKEVCMSCCPFLTGTGGHMPYLVVMLLAFCAVGIVILAKKLNDIIKLLRKK